ncbi:site-specific integrase [Salibacterium aidingense]|uniref:site-specific integrase n=1 Tax=Salibacterium aidingense TaxID=384933 RepID=UPI003BD8B410
MKGSFYRRGCICERKRCSCGAKWAFTIDIGNDSRTGRRRQRQKSGFLTREEAESVATELIYELKKGSYVEEKNILFKDFAEQWLNIYSDSRKVKPGTIRVRKHEIDKLMPYFAHLKLKDITQDTFQKAIYSLKETGYADNTLDGIFRTGKMIFRKAIEMRIIKYNPNEFAYLPRDEKFIYDWEDEVPKYLEKEELLLFLNTAKEKGLELDYLIFLTLSYTGLRVGELVSLRWDDIDFVQQTINVSKTYYNPNNNTIKYQLLPPKTKGSRRRIVVEETVLEAMKMHKASQNNIRKNYGKDYHSKDFIFAKSERHPGYPICIKQIQNRMRRLLKLAGLNNNLTPHSLRHTHTSLLAESKVVLEDIMDRLGHTDDKITRTVYRHVTKEMKKEASQKFGQLMRSL